ncbi:MAG TPA: hypothetical protein VL175_08765 [Pirellulales bacterium]|jgi:hypothetical protein|nr:hypothetical protein [Pirellulales bacterium]
MAETYDARTEPGWWFRARHTPLRDAVRGQWTNSLDARQAARIAGLPEPLPNFIYLAVRRTRLWPSERLDVARELISHFADGLASGRSAEELIAKFGDVERAAGLIREAKLRGRPLWWHAMRFAVRVLFVLFAVTLVVYIAWGIRFYLGRPVVAHNYWKEINLARHVPEGERAWPIYREAALKLGRDDVDFECLFVGPACLRYEDELKKAERHRDSIELVREGAKRARLGYYWGDPADRAAGIAHGRPDQFSKQSADENRELFTAHLAGIDLLRQLARLIAGDALRAAAAGDGLTARQDIESLVVMAGQLMEPTSSLVEQLVGSALFKMAMQAAGRTLYETPQVWSDEDLRDLAHRIAAYRASGASYSLAADRMFFDDLLQRAYTDDGDGDGRMTAEGVQLIVRVAGDLGWLAPLRVDASSKTPAQPGVSGTDSVRRKTLDSLRYIATPGVAALFGSREENRALYYKMLDEMIAAHEGPAWLWKQVELDPLVLGPPHSSRTRLRYWLVSLLLPAVDSVFAAQEREQQIKDATLVAIALELWHRRHGEWPAKLDELVPDLLPAVPPDRVDGQPLRYVIRDGRPILYSIGGDRNDGGGVAPEDPASAQPYRFGVYEDASKDETGDWILWPAQPDRPYVADPLSEEPAESAP